MEHRSTGEVGETPVLYSRSQGESTREENVPKRRAWSTPNAAEKSEEMRTGESFGYRDHGRIYSMEVG